MSFKTNQKLQTMAATRNQEERETKGSRANKKTARILLQAQR